MAAPVSESMLHQKIGALPKRSANLRPESVRCQYLAFAYPLPVEPGCTDGAHLGIECQVRAHLNLRSVGSPQVVGSTALDQVRRHLPDALLKALHDAGTS